MALVDLAAVAAALSQSFAPKLAIQSNRSAVLMSLIPKALGAGKNCAWDAEFDGATAAAYSETATISAFDSDLSVPATIGWGLYRSAFGIGGVAMAAAASSSSPAELTNLYLAKLDGSASKLCSTMNAALYSGSGANNFIGLATAVDSTGAYAGIDPGTYAQWVATELGNGSTVRELTKALIDQLETSIYAASGKSPNCYVTTPAIGKAFKGLFDPSMKFSGAQGDISALSAIASVLGDSIVIPPAMSSNLVGFYEGRPVFRDKDCTPGTFYGLNTEQLSLETLPQAGFKTATMVASKELRGNPGDRLTGVVATVEAVHTPSDTSNMVVKAYAQLKVHSRNAHGKITDLPTT